MSNPENELCRLIRDVALEWGEAVTVAMLENELDRARFDLRQAKARVDVLRKRIRRAKALLGKSRNSVAEWFGEEGAAT